MGTNINILDVSTGLVHKNVSLSGQKYIDGRLAIYDGKLVNGFIEHIEEVVDGDQDVSAPLIYNSISDDLMYASTRSIRLLKERDKLLEFCERMNIHNIIDTNVSNGAIVDKILKIRAIVKKQRMIVK